jgi:hypothetical protein
MKSERHRFSGLTRAVAAALLVSFVSMVACPQIAMAKPGDETIYERFEDVSSLRSQGRYEEAIEILRGIVAEPSQSDEILRRAYSDLVFTLLSKEDTAEATKTATEALYRFPDLAADPVYFPPRVNDVYDSLRDRMFGALNVATRPESCRVFLDGEFVGHSPLMLEYVRVGEYDLSVTRSGYRDESTPVRIEPGRPTSVPLSLQRERGKGWWIARIGPAALLAGVLLAIRSQKEEPTEPGRLPGPPPPP